METKQSIKTDSFYCIQSIDYVLLAGSSSLEYICYSDCIKIFLEEHKGMKGW